MMDLLDLSQYLGLPPAASAQAGELDHMLGLVHWLMLILFLIWAPYFIYVLWRFRASRNPIASHDGAQGRSSTYLEGGIVLAEVVLLFGFAIPTWGVMRDDLPATPDAVEVHVVAEQFAWNVHYPGADGTFGRRDPALIDVQRNPLGLDQGDPAAQDDVVTVNELHIPTGRPILVYLSSKDVIHSFALPVMRVKQDVIPGLNIPVWFEATQEGEYEIGCAQLCGLSHYRMRGFLTVHSPEAFEQWLAEF